MEELLNSIDGVTVLREIEGSVANPSLGKLVITFTILFFAAGLFLIICALRTRDYLDLPLLWYALFQFTVAGFGLCFSRSSIVVGDLTKYEIVLDEDADRVSLAEAFKVVKDNGLTLIVEPQKEG